MNDEKKTVEELDQVFAAGDAWLRKYGMVTSIQHNAVVANLYVNFPKVRYLEYFLPEDNARRKVWVRLYVPFWKLLFLNRDKMMDDVIDFLREYLADYDIKVELKRYKKGVEKSDEVPEIALEHVAASPDELQPDEVTTLTATEPPPAAEPARGDDPKGPEAAPAEHGDVPPVPDSSDSGDPKPSV